MIKRIWALVKRLILMLFVIVAGCIAYYFFQAQQRPERTALKQTLFDGIVYERQFLETPRPILTHIFTVDLTTSTLEFMVTPPNRLTEKDHIDARTTSEFVTEFEPQLAINASFFYPFTQRTPLTYYPRTGQSVSTLGLTIADGVTYSPENGMRTMCIIGRTITLERRGCPADTEHAVSGNALFVRDGRAAITSDELLNKPYARTAVALSESADTLWIVIVDGKQPFYSEGMTLTELANFVIDMGGDRAVNLDGGGSVTAVVQSEHGPQVLNAPIHARIPMWERPVANHIGIFAQPATESVAAEQR